MTESCKLPRRKLEILARNLGAEKYTETALPEKGNVETVCYSWNERNGYKSAAILRGRKSGKLYYWPTPNL